MGWSYGWNSKKELVNYLKDGFSKGYTPVRSSLVGNHLWSLVQRDEDQSKFISLSLIACHEGDWGYKGISEDMGPSYYDCPLNLLNEATEPQGGYAKEWREKALAYHENQKARPEYAAGQIWVLDDVPYKLIEKAGLRRGWRVISKANGQTYRMPFTYLKQARYEGMEA